MVTRGDLVSDELGEPKRFKISTGSGRGQIREGGASAGGDRVVAIRLGELEVVGGVGRGVGGSGVSGIVVAVLQAGRVRHVGEGGASIGTVPKCLATGTELPAVAGEVIGEIPCPVTMVPQPNRVR